MSVRHKIHYETLMKAPLYSLVVCNAYPHRHTTDNKICVTCKDCLELIKEKSE